MFGRLSVETILGRLLVLKDTHPNVTSILFMTAIMPLYLWQSPEILRDFWEKQTKKFQNYFKEMS